MYTHLITLEKLCVVFGSEKKSKRKTQITKKKQQEIFLQQKHATSEKSWLYRIKT
jgi:hypothetical protein